LLNEARAALALKQLDRAGIKYTSVLDIDPTNVVALSSLGAIRYQQNHYDEAEDYLRKAVAGAQRCGNAVAARGRVLPQGIDRGFVQ
jgi:tetratricopeptide (TPR) repeat protein